MSKTLIKKQVVSKRMHSLSQRDVNPVDKVISYKEVEIEHLKTAL